MPAMLSDRLFIVLEAAAFGDWQLGGITDQVCCYDSCQISFFSFQLHLFVGGKLMLNKCSERSDKFVRKSLCYEQWCMVGKHPRATQTCSGIISCVNARIVS